MSQLLRVVITALFFVATAALAADVPLHGRRIPLPALHAEPDPVAAGASSTPRAARCCCAASTSTRSPSTGSTATSRRRSRSTRRRRRSDRGDRLERRAPAALVVARRAAPGVTTTPTSTQVETAVRLLARRGVYSIIDLHQDAWGATLAARPDEVCTPPARAGVRLGRRAGLGDARRRCARAASRSRGELSPAVLAAFSAFFIECAGPGRRRHPRRATRACSGTSRARFAGPSRSPATTS